MAFDWEQITRDFQQKYEATYIRVRLKDDLEVFWVQKVNYGEPPYIILRNKERGEIQLNYGTEFELNFEFPPVGLFEFDNMAKIFMRRYSRQWKRGINVGTAAIEMPYTTLIKVPFTPPFDELNIIASFQPRTLCRVEDATARLQSKSILSKSLNNCFSLGLDIRKSDRLLLWYLSSLVGEFDDGTFYIREPQFKQEFMDYLRTTGEHFDIVS